MGTYSAEYEAEVTHSALQAAAGDNAALDFFVRSTQADVWRFIAYLGHRSTADDLTQETFLRAIKSLPRFTAQSTARTWLLSIARRVCADEVRRAMSRPRIAGTADWVAAAETRRAQVTPIRWQEIVETKVMIDLLPEDRREALVLTQILGLSYQEAADVLGCPIGTVRSRVARAREALVEAASASDERSRSV
ncbi:RNA polymerase sigma factor [Gordonia spumicola]|uniref:RNA polymerase sigma factor n=1 Tax=Gordonia spumicola TaxID=589161 RepID=A0A7I9V5E0_9ACTN|nr:sigma-70 family RNA polymerase sigma factor [Gordonia spumicola]GEE00606.1 RNA polymerase sigma factor [Gordonia spumicola]